MMELLPICMTSVLSLSFPTCLPVSAGAIVFANTWPWWMWLILCTLCVVILSYTYLRIWDRTGRRLAWWLLGLRLAGVISLLIVLASPVWSTTKTQTHKPALMLVIDDSASMTLPAEHDITSKPAAAAAAPMSRVDAMRHLLADDKVRKLLDDRFDISRQTLQGKLITDDQSSIDASESQTDLLRALHLAANRARGNGAQSLVLISDGHDTSQRSDWLSLSNYPLRVYTIGFPKQSADHSGIDLALSKLDAPAQALVHHQVSIKFTMTRTAGDGKAMDVPVTLSHASKPLVSKTVKLPAGERASTQVTLDYLPDEPGDFELTLSTPVQQGEKDVSNNQLEMRLRVNNQPMRVLYVEGQLRPEFTFLKARLADDPDVNLITFVRTGRPESLGSDLVSSDLISPERLKEIDVILLGDFEATMLSPDAWKVIANWVNSGGGVMVLGGYHNLGPRGFGTTALADLLPVSLSGPQAGQQLDEPFSFSPTPEGLTNPVLKLSDQPVADLKTWSSLAPLPGIVITGHAKPAATVLVRHPRSADGPKGQGYVVLATQSTGKGRTAILTADTTWRWSRIARLTGRPDSQYARFWSQMIRYLAKRPADLTEKPLTITTDTPTYEPGERVNLQIHRNAAVVIPGVSQPSQTVDDNSSTSLASTILVEVMRDQQHLTQLIATPSSTPGQWTASYYPDQPGRYEAIASLTVPSGNQKKRTIASSSTRWYVQGNQEELQDASPNPELLQQIAKLTQGRYTTLNQTQAVLDMLKSIPEPASVTQQTTRHTLWNNPLFFLIFLGCVSSEWLIRRRNRLM